MSGGIQLTTVLKGRGFIDGLLFVRVQVTLPESFSLDVECINHVRSKARCCVIAFALALIACKNSRGQIFGKRPFSSGLFCRLPSKTLFFYCVHSAAEETQASCWLLYGVIVFNECPFVNIHRFVDCCIESYFFVYCCMLHYIWYFGTYFIYLLP